MIENELLDDMLESNLQTIFGLQARPCQYFGIVNQISGQALLLEEDTDSSLENCLSSQDAEETDEVMEVN